MNCAFEADRQDRQEAVQHPPPGDQRRDPTVLPCRIAGRAGRVGALPQLLEHQPRHGVDDARRDEPRADAPARVPTCWSWRPSLRRFVGHSIHPDHRQHGDRDDHQSDDRAGVDPDRVLERLLADGPVEEPSGLARQPELVDYRQQLQRQVDPQQHDHRLGDAADALERAAVSPRTAVGHVARRWRHRWWRRWRHAAHCGPA